MLVSYCLRESVDKIGLRGYVQYESHMAVLILVKRAQNTIEATHNNSVNKYQNWITLNNKGDINRYREIIGLKPRLWF